MKFNLILFLFIVLVVILYLKDAEAAPRPRPQEAAEEVPDWCNPNANLGAHLLFPAIKTYCLDAGFTDLGVYGGPVAVEPAEE